MGLVAWMVIARIWLASRSTNLVKDIQARREAMHAEQRQRIFLRALDDEMPDA